MDYYLIFELLGTVAFAVSGAQTAIKKHMDLFGVIVLGMTGAIGGGIVRDMILGISPPVAFHEPVYALTAIAVSAMMFIPFVRKIAGKSEALLLIMDSVGLGVFTIVGVNACVQENNMFLSVFIGVLTGTGGGILRDLFAGDQPAVFVKHFYATASLIGAAIASFFYPVAGEAANITGVVVIILLRLLAAHYKWSLPKA